MGKNPTVAFILTRGIMAAAVIYMASLPSLVHSATNEFVVPNNIGCICSGSVVTYECRIVGAGNTQWTGSLFDCLQNGIFLRHNRFSSGGVAGDCNQGAVIARSIGVENNCYSSQLTFTANVALSNKTILCVHNSISGDITIGMSIPTIVGPGGPYPPPENVVLTTVRQRMLTFSWTSSATMCTSLVYNITSSCGSCPTSTTTTAVSCTNLQVSSRESNCTFSVHSMVCGTIGPASAPVILRFKVPDAPRVTILPVYSNSSNLLSKVLSRVNQAGFSNLSFTKGEIGIVDSYRTYINTTPVETNPSCLNDECEHATNVPLDLCNRPEADISVTVTANNGFGESAPSQLFNFGCENKLVRVEYDSVTANIICQFLNSSDDSVKSCSIQYGICHDEQRKTIFGNTTSDTVTLKLDIDGSGRGYCYTITAISGTHMVKIEGSTAQSGRPFPIEVVAPFVIVVVLIVGAVIGITVTVIAHQVRRNEVKPNGSEECARLEMQPIYKLQSRDLEICDQNELVIVEYEVPEDCSLNEFLAKKELPLKRGCVLFEFNHVETITEDMLVLVKAASNNKYHTLDKESAVYKTKLLGERVLIPSFEGYSVFIQSKDGGRRHLQEGSKLLYMFTNLWRVVRQDFCFVHSASEDRQLNSIVNELDDVSKGNFYFERESNTGGEELMPGANIILENVKTDYLLTGPHALLVSQQTELDKNQWRVYVYKEHQENMMVPKNSAVMYKVENEQEHPKIEVPFKLVYTRIHSEQFERKEVKEKCELKLFRQKFDLSPDEPVFIEIDNAHEGYAEKSMYTIIINEERKDYFACPFPVDDFQALRSESITCATEETFFVMCTPSQTFQLPERSWVLYNCSVSKTLWMPGLLPIRSDFVPLRVEEGDTMEQIIKEHGLEDDCAIFFELGSVQRHCSVRDVILMENMCSEHKKLIQLQLSQPVDAPLYSGPLARSKFNSLDNAEAQKQCEDWKFLLLSHGNSWTVTKTCNVYHQKFPESKPWFKVLTVDQDDNVRMSDFIQTKLKGKFDSSKAFYEFNEKEDLLYFREIVVMDMGNTTTSVDVHHADEGAVTTTECSFESYYKMSDKTPGFEIMPREDTKSNMKRFIQSISQASRCLKRGDTVLYELNE